MSYDISLRIDTGGSYPHEVYQSNITFNLHRMFSNAFRYNGQLSDSINFLDGMKAEDAAAHLGKAVERMKKYPDYFRQFDSPNGWGIYDHALPMLEEWLAACLEHPKTIVKIDK